MPSRKQRRREAKSKRHEYEFVYLDAEGHELEELPDEAEPSIRKPRAVSTNGSKPAAKKQSGRPARARREPPPPSWQRAGKRSLLLGAVVFALFALESRKHGYLQPALLALVYTGLFVPFTYLIDRFAYRRFQARQESGGAGSPQRPKKR